MVLDFYNLSGNHGSMPLPIFFRRQKFFFGEEPSEVPSGDPEVILSSEGSEDVETSPPCGASLLLGVEYF